MALTQETILTFLLEHGGKVKNSDLLNHFKCQLNCSDPENKKHNRDIFKKLVNSVAVVKQVDEVKFVVVKKRYQDFVKGGMNCYVQNSDLEDSYCSLTASLSPTVFERSALVRHESDKILNLDIENNNTGDSSNMHGNSLSGKPNYNHKLMHTSDRERGLRNGAVGSCRTVNEETSTVVRVLNVPHNQIKTGKTGPVFAIVAVKSPPQLLGYSAPVSQTETNYIPTVAGQTTPVRSKPSIPVNVLPTERGVIPLLRDVGRTGTDQNERSSPWKHKPQEMYRPVSPLLRRPHTKASKPGEDPKSSESVPLDPVVHQWLVKTAAGLWGQIYGLLLQDSQLAEKRDFICGFTALHWAAKSGNSQMVRNIMDISRRRGVCVDVNSRTHGGYTALHVAAIHGHDVVMVLLVQLYGANANIRDNHGKKPIHYLGRGVSAELRELLGRAEVSQQGRDQGRAEGRAGGRDQGRDQGRAGGRVEGRAGGRVEGRVEWRAEEEDYRELPRGLNTLSRLFLQPHMMGHRKKPRQPQGSIPSTAERD